MTQNTGDTGLCFEIWFRKRKSQDTYTLQAASREVKETWARDLERILWEQAIHNRGTVHINTHQLLHLEDSFHKRKTKNKTQRSISSCTISQWMYHLKITQMVSHVIFLEVRLQERVFLGIGNKPFMDIQPSEAAINDRAIDYVLMGRGEYLMFLNKFVTSQTLTRFLVVRKQRPVLCGIMCITGRASRRAAKVCWFKEQLFFLLVLWTGLPLPRGVLVWTKAEGDCRGPWTICITPRSPGGGRSWPREWKSAFIVWVKPWSE